MKLTEVKFWNDYWRGYKLPNEVQISREMYCTKYARSSNSKAKQLLEILNSMPGSKNYE